MTKMTITVFVDWTNEEIISEKERKGKIEEIADYLKGDEEAIERFLTYVNDYSIADVFGMDDSDKAGVMEKFQEFCLEQAETQFTEEYGEIELEI